MEVHQAENLPCSLDVQAASADDVRVIMLQKYRVKNSQKRHK